MNTIPERNLHLIISFFTTIIKDTERKQSKSPPARDSSPTLEVLVAPFLAGKGGGLSADSSWTKLPLLAGSTGGISAYSGSLLSLKSSNKSHSGNMLAKNSLEGWRGRVH